MPAAAADGAAGATNGRTLGGWTQLLTPDGRVYFYSPESGMTQGARPLSTRGRGGGGRGGGGEAAAAEAAAAAGGWRRRARGAAAGRRHRQRRGGRRRRRQGGGGGEAAPAAADEARGPGKRARQAERRREREAAATKDGGGKGESSAPLTSAVHTSAAASDAAAQTPLLSAAAASVSADDAAEAFTALLDETARKHAAIAAAEWDGVLGLIVFDKRYGQVKTLAQRKSLFEAGGARGATSVVGARRASQPARDAFVAMVVAALSSTAGVRTTPSSLGQTRWIALDADARRDAFDDTTDDRRRAERARAQRRQEERAITRGLRDAAA